MVENPLTVRQVNLNGAYTHAAADLLTDDHYTTYS